ncbi:hypothetical protein EB18_01151 [Enterococcus cecorum]|uniref:Uncharacterized protein n=1 Tax=Enterococcus cecorum TaxID=44008 RepID=A0A366SIJ0_9ENTE|nr:hypothetical protein EB18_01151 [Enterococcus cecorum]RBR32859.1 hypothetical protein EB06_01045 [Enterococcus cecorum]
MSHYLQQVAALFYYLKFIISSRLTYPFIAEDSGQS